MIGHQGKSMHLPSGSTADLGQGRQKSLAIRVVPKYPPQLVPAIHQMINRARVFDPWCSRHARATCQNNKSLSNPKSKD